MAANSWPKLAAILTCCTIVVIISTSTASSATNKTSKARISLQTNSFDIDQNDQSPISDEASQSVGAETNSNKRRDTKKSSRRLSNIWSMFLPGSSSNADSDYEDSVESSSSADESGADQSASDAVLANTTNLVVTHNDPPRFIEPNRSHSNGDMMASSSGQQVRSGSPPPTTTTPAPGNQSSVTDQPVQLITGALSAFESANSTNQPAKSTTEREAEDEQDETKANQTVGPTTNTKSNNFERWLNRIKFKQEDTTTPTTAPTTTTTMRPRDPPMATRPLRASPAWHLKQIPDRGGTKTRQPTDETAEGVKGMPRRTLSAQQEAAGRFKFQAHPFQQQMRQQQAQLIHGIKYPAAQASTISVSTQDGASNTSLSFGSHFHIPQLGSLTNAITETSQAINSTSAPATNSQPESNQIEQSAYQSQDEILRQVTSAINFEQQLIQQKRQHQNHKPAADDDHQHNGTSDNNHNNNEGDSQSSRLFKVGSSLSELFDPTTTSTTPASQQSTTNSNNLTPMELLKANLSTNNTQTVGTEDLDKNFDLLADKVRLLASQNQQQPNGTNLPSWLRPQAAQAKELLSGNLTRLLTGNSQAQQQLNLDQLRELVNRHERTKNELKSSQESMEQLMRQLAHLKTDNHTMIKFTQTGGDSHKQSGEPNQPSSVTNIGWTPVGRPPNQQLLLSANQQPPLRSHQLPMRISQMSDNIALNNDDIAGDDYFANNLAIMLANQGSNNHLEGHDMSQKIIGLPIAFVKDDEIELSPGQIEEAARMAAEQLGVAPHQPPPGRSPPLAPSLQMNRPNNKFVQRLAPPNQQPPRPLVNQHHQDGAQLNHVQKLLQSSSPQTFTGMQQNAHNLMQMNNKLASLIPHEAPGMNHEQSMVGFEPATNQIAEVNEPEGGTRLAQVANTQQTSNLVDSNDNQNSKQPPSAPKLNKQQENDTNLINNRNSNQNNPTGRQTVGSFLPNQQMISTRPTNSDTQTLGLHRQALQSGPMFEPLARNLIGQYGQLPHPVGGSFIQGISPFIQPHRPLLTTTMSASGGAGPPLKLREVSLYRPFGFRGHHAVSYQPSPAVSAMFHGAQSQPGRPSILRHMTPIRAGLSESQRLLSPFIPHQLMEHLSHNRHHLHQYPSHTPMGTLPIPPMRHGGGGGAGLFFPAGGHQQLRRQSNPRASNTRHHHLAGHEAGPRDHYAATKIRVRHLDASHEPEELDEEAKILIENEPSTQHLGGLKYISLPDEMAPDAFEGELEQHILQVPIEDKIMVTTGGKRSTRPGRQMRQQASSRFQEPRRSQAPPALLAVDKPSSLMAMKQQPPCIPVNITTPTPMPGQRMNSSSPNTTTSWSTEPTLTTTIMTKPSNSTTNSTMTTNQ